MRAAWILHGASLALTLLGDSPHFGFAPALSFTAWLMVLVYTVERIGEITSANFTRLFPRVSS